MSLVRPVVLALVLLGGVFAPPFAGIAHAQQAPIPANGIVAFLGTGDVVGDGTTPAMLYVLALGADGRPIAGFKPRVTSDAGMAQGWTEVGNGLYSVSFTPPAVDATRTIAVRLRGKNAAKVDIAADLNVRVVPPVASSIAITANPPQVTLDAGAEATLSFQLSGGALTAADLMISASAGEVANLTDMGGGKWTARFIAPKVNYPHLAVITVADKRDPTRSHGVVVVPLLGKTDYPVKAAPNASVMLKIGDREFGPVQTAADGQAVVPIVVPPGVPEATLVSVVGGVSTDEVFDLRVPETKRIRMFPVQVAIPGDPAMRVPVRVSVRTPDGRPDVAAKVVFNATSGAMSPARHEGDGVYVADYTPPTMNAAGSTTITASLEGSQVQVDTRDVGMLPMRPARVQLTAEPASLAADTATFKVFAKILGPDARGLTGRQVDVTAVGATAKGPAQDLGNGDYRIDFATNGGGPVELIGTVAGPSSGNPLAHVTIVSNREKLADDGASSSVLTIATVDSFGYPVPNVPVTLQLDGDGALPANAVTNASGTAQVAYTAGKSARVVRITATAGDRTGATSIAQVPPGTEVPDLPAPGSDAVRAIDGTWQSAIGALRLDRAGAAAATAPPPVLPSTVAGGSVSALQVKADPASAPPGGSVKLRVHAADAQGRGVAGMQLETLTSIGKFGAVTDLGGGDYDIVLALPMDATGEAKVSIASSDGAISTFVKIPIAAAGSAWTTPPATTPMTPPTTTTPPPTTTTTPPTTTTTPPPETTPPTAIVPPTPPETVKVPKPPRPESDAPWLRLGAGWVGSSYHYSQRPTADSGSLLAEPFLVGGRDGGANAVPQGFELHARVFPESVKYIGTDSSFDLGYYAVTAPEFNGANVPDMLVNVRIDAVGRYPFDAGSSHFSIGARAGLRYSDFTVYKGCLDAGCEVQYSTLPLPGFDLGLDAGADISDLFVVLGIEEGFYYATPYLTQVDARTGWQFSPNLYGDIGFEAVSRKIKLIGDTSQNELGTLADGQMMFKIGIGYSI
jgi:hypothetical protein